jgi:hypothetical protein
MSRRPRAFGEADQNLPLSLSQHGEQLTDELFPRSRLRSRSLGTSPVSLGAPGLASCHAVDDSDQAVDRFILAHPADGASLESAYHASRV